MSVEASGGEGPRPGLLLLGVIALVLTAYSNVLPAPFVWDDFVLIQERSAVRKARLADVFTLPFLPDASGKAAAPYYRPLVTSTYVADWKLWHGQPFGFHATNLALHLLVVSLLFAVARHAGAGGLAAAGAAAAFGLFPRLTESVSWVSGRTDVLAAVFVLLALRLHPAAPGRWGLRAASALALLAGLLSKEVAAAGFVAVAVLEAARARRGDQAWRAAVVHLMPLAVAGGGYAGLRHLALRAHEFKSAPSVTAPSRPMVVLEALGRYVSMVADPFHPKLQMGWIGERAPGYVALGVVAAIALVAGLWWAWRHPPRPWVAAALALSLASILPVLQFIPLTLVVAADRFLYLPVAGLAIAAAVASGRLAPERLRRGVALLVALLVLVEAVVTFRRNEEWSDEVRLWTATLETASPRNPVPANELANALRKAWRTEESLPWYQKALETAGISNLTIVTNVAHNLAELGRFEDARNALRLVMTRQPEILIHYVTLARIEAQELRFDAAREVLAAADRFHPGDPTVSRLRATLERFEADARKLPPEEAAEPTSRVAERATFWTNLGNRPEAVRQWVRYVGRDDALPGLLADAATYIVLNGTPEEATWAIERARKAGVDPGRLAEIELSQAWRFPGAR